MFPFSFGTEHPKNNVNLCHRTEPYEDAAVWPEIGHGIDGAGSPQCTHDGALGHLIAIRLSLDLSHCARIR